MSAITKISTNTCSVVITRGKNAGKLCKDVNLRCCTLSHKNGTRSTSVSPVSFSSNTISINNPTVNPAFQSNISQATNISVDIIDAPVSKAKQPIVQPGNVTIADPTMLTDPDIIVEMEKSVQILMSQCGLSENKARKIASKTAYAKQLYLNEKLLAEDKAKADLFAKMPKLHKNGNEFFTAFAATFDSKAEMKEFLINVIPKEHQGACMILERGYKSPDGLYPFMFPDGKNKVSYLDFEGKQGNDYDFFRNHIRRCIHQVYSVYMGDLFAEESAYLDKNTNPDYIGYSSINKKYGNDHFDLCHKMYNDLGPDYSLGSTGGLMVGEGKKAATITESIIQMFKQKYLQANN
jgi:hypothetical protein